MPDLKGISFSVSRHAHGVDGYFAMPTDVRSWLATLLDDSEAG